LEGLRELYDRFLQLALKIRARPAAIIILFGIGISTAFAGSWLYYLSEGLKENELLSVVLHVSSISFSHFSGAIFALLMASAVYFVFFREEYSKSPSKQLDIERPGQLSSEELGYVQAVIVRLRSLFPAERFTSTINLKAIFSSQVAHGVSERHLNAWIEFALSAKVTALPAVSTAWATLYKSILDSEVSQIKSGHVSTTSEIYADFICNTSDSLLAEFPGCSVNLDLVTALLPSEFYNWPQVEVQREATRLAADIIPHTWTNSIRYFQRMSALSKIVRLRRHVMVRKSTAIGHLPLRLIADLKKQSKNYIAPFEVNSSYFFTNNLMDLLKTTTGLSPDRLRKFVALDDFRFYPIGDLDKISAAGMSKPKPLIEHFTNQLHSKEEDARFFEITVDTAPCLEALTTGRRLAAGHLPELAYFRLYRDGVSTPFADFAILSELTPYTEAMEVHLIPDVTARLKMTEFLKELEAGSRPLSELWDPSTATPAIA
jgi:hypothetical protein